jgi:hypothetical protein
MIKLIRIMSNIWHQIEGVMARISKTNALYPLLIGLLFLIVLAGCVFYFTENTLLRFSSLILVGMIVYQIMKSFDYFSKNNPEMLRTERMVIQQQALSLLGDERKLNASAKDIISIINPNNPISKSDMLVDGLNEESLLEKTNEL